MAFLEEVAAGAGERAAALKGVMAPHMPTAKGLERTLRRRLDQKSDAHKLVARLWTAGGGGGGSCVGCLAAKVRMRERGRWAMRERVK